LKNSDIGTSATIKNEYHSNLGVFFYEISRDFSVFNSLWALKEFREVILKDKRRLRRNEARTTKA
jgi:hypothetical protein